MIVAYIVNTVSGKKVQNATAIGREQLSSRASFIADSKVQHVQQLHPLWVHVLGVEGVGRDVFCKMHFVYEPRKLNDWKCT